MWSYTSMLLSDLLHFSIVCRIEKIGIIHMYYRPYCYNFAIKHWETDLTLRQVWDLFPRVWRQMEDVTLLRNPLLLWQTGVSNNSGTLNSLILKCIWCNYNKIGLKGHYVNFFNNPLVRTNLLMLYICYCFKTQPDWLTTGGKQVPLCGRMEEV